MQKNIDAKELTRRFRTLITRHGELLSKDTERLGRVLRELLPTFREARKQWADSQRISADDFNLFKVMEVEADEVRHSKILAWLLDHRIEHGTHAQGNLGFRLFLEEFDDELKQGGNGQPAAYANEPNYWVRCELSGSEARVDIEIAARGKFLIHLENKILSAEGEDQTCREWRDLQTRRKELDVPEAACHAFFLTLDGTRAKCERFRSVGWNRIAKTLDRFADQAEPTEVKLFARHYAKAVRMMSVAECRAGEVDDAAV